ncbi:serine hydrolase [Mangrovivirga sp. M17]|uniref:Serine hydrolase n=1 Tax=Mangrovivirga halotolerans TaxID=2993936 RepID=A0ABT3RPL6_9BACT|nr:serine hydrolase domain-containing protein [Mangrovivirga halotolerans]MCX2743732.1 serine hydrolase [Mangrovivirga halotolerans]
MNRQIFWLLLITIFLSNCTEKKSDPNHSSLEVYTDSLFKATIDSGFIAGASVMVVKKGEVLIDTSYGYASLELSAPMPENPSFEIGSVTKQFTAAAILKLSEDNKLSLDDDFTKYLEFDTKGRIVTINHLLYHTSGIASYTEFPEFMDFSVQQHDPDSLIRWIEQKDFSVEPGESMLYNNSAYVFLGRIIEEVSGMTYEEYLQKEFFKPLGMEHTYYASNTEVVKDKVYGYRYSPDGLKQKRYLNHTWPFAAGSLCSTTEDLLIWMKALHEKQILDEDLYASLIKTGELNDGTKLRYAKGLDNYFHYGNQVIQHGGAINGFLSDTKYFPEEDLYIICLVNTIGPKGASFFSEQLTWQLLEKQEPENIALDMNLQTLEGKYKGAMRNYNLVVEVKALDSSLVLTRENQKPDTLKHYIGNNSFWYNNQVYKFKNEDLHADVVYGYYIFDKIEE